MAISFDSFGTGVTSSTDGTIQWTHTMNSSNGIILAFFYPPGTMNLNASPTYAGTAMTKILAGTQGFNGEEAEVWYLSNPPTGLGTFQGTFSAATNQKKGLSLAYTGVSSGNPIIGSAKYLGSNVTSGSITADMLAFNWWVGGRASPTTPGTTSIGNERGTTTFVSSELMGADSTGGTLQWTFSAQGVVLLGVQLNSGSTAGTNLIQSAGTTTLASTTTSPSWGGNTTTGNMIVVGIAVTNATTLGTVSAVTDTQNNTYTRALRGTISEITSVVDGELWYAPNITGGAGSVTVTHTSDNASVFVREYSGLYNVLDAVGSATGATTAVNSGTTGVPTQNNELVIVVTADDKGAAQTYTAAGAYGDMVGTTATLTGISMEDNIINTGGAQTGTQTLGGTANWVSLCATFGRVSNTGILQGLTQSLKPISI